MKSSAGITKDVKKVYTVETAKKINKESIGMTVLMAFIVCCFCLAAAIDSGHPTEGLKNPNSNNWFEDANVLPSERELGNKEITVVFPTKVLLQFISFEEK
ncbi:hypothetical protein OWV82_023253 [Melia azedarach]|uniref:Uncharacterized protein n=1 Tax=Melia azedarach TaxID=155640 RepID=A0ACC1WWC9_MELAZ|nr:hypothetical protein OWV82_023253 [Melia azedarach]